MNSDWILTLDSEYSIFASDWISNLLLRKSSITSLIIWFWSLHNDNVGSIEIVVEEEEELVVEVVVVALELPVRVLL